MKAICVILYLAFTITVSIIAGRTVRVKHPNIENGDA